MKTTRIRKYSQVQERAVELRQQMTPAEQLLWAALRSRKLGGYKFRRQHPLGPFIVDFYCTECRLVIEVDGGIHKLQFEADEQRSNQLQDYNYHVIRFSNEEVENHLGDVLNAILGYCKNLSASNSLLPILGEGLGDEGSV